MLWWAVEVGPGQSPPLGILVIGLLSGASYLLFRSMRKQLRRIPASFDPPPTAPEAPPPVPNPAPTTPADDPR